MKTNFILPLAGLLVSVVGCGSIGGRVEPHAVGLAVAESSAGVEATFSRLDSALTAAPPVSVIARIDHAANAPADLPLRPTRVILFGNPMLGTPLMQANQVAGIDLPQKFLVYQDAAGRTMVGYNSTDYLAQRHGVGAVETLPKINGVLKMFAEKASGGEVSTPGTETVARDEGLVSIASNADAQTTYGRLRGAVQANPALKIVAELDHAANAARVGLQLRPTRLIVFGNPALGTPLMRSAQTFGIDLPQKMLVYTDASGRTFVVYNDPAFLAKRHAATGVDESVGKINMALGRLAATAAGN